MSSMKLQHIAVTAVTIMILTATVAPAQAQDVAVAYTWTAPTTGSAVDHYVVEHQVNGGAWTPIATVTSNQYTLTASLGDTHSIRVAAVDAQDRQGIYSPASDPYTPDPGAPGQPGKPIVF
jgi:hypothetical protein